LDVNFPAPGEIPNRRPSSLPYPEKPTKILTETKQFMNRSRVPETPEKTWICRFCKWPNPNNNIKCTTCGKLHPQADVRGTPSTPHLSPKEWWTCSGCTYMENSLYLANCILCGAPRCVIGEATEEHENSENIPISKGKNKTTIKTMAYLVKPRTIIHKE